MQFVHLTKGESPKYHDTFTKDCNQINIDQVEFYSLGIDFVKFADLMSKKLGVTVNPMPKPFNQTFQFNIKKNGSDVNVDAKAFLGLP